jgi:predicted nucleic acid-binding protein
MAHRQWVVNASPLILLGKIGHLALLGALADQLTVPRAVADEIGVKPDGGATLQAISDIPSFVIVENEVATPEILSWDLGAGETQVLAHALAHKAERVVIDDLEARRCAKAMGLGIIGTLSTVGRARANGLIDQVEPVVRRLRETGLYASDELVRRLLNEVGE